MYIKMSGVRKKPIMVLTLRYQVNDILCTCSSLSAVNEYVFMVQARGIQIRENMRNIGAQVLEQVVRGAYSLNSTGEQSLTDGPRCFYRGGQMF